MGLHVQSALAAGTIGFCEGYSFAGADTLHIRVTISTLQTIVSRETDPQDPVVITVGRIRGGTRANIIAEEVKMSATIRTLNAQTPLHNDDDMIELTRRCAIEVVGQDSVVDVSPSMGGEDFSYFAQEAPGAYFRLGVGNEEKDIVYAMHHPKFDVDESALPVGTAIIAYSAWRFLEEGSRD